MNGVVERSGEDSKQNLDDWDAILVVSKPMSKAKYGMYKKLADK